MRQAQGLPQRRHGLWVAGVVGVVLAAVVAAGALLYYGRLQRERRPARVGEVTEAASANAFLPSTNGAQRVALPVDDEGKRERDAIRKNLEEQRQFNEWLKAELDRMQKTRQERPTAARAERTPAAKPREKTYHQIFLTRERATAPGVSPRMLTAGTWIPCTLEPILNSEIPGPFTLKTRRPVYDSLTGRSVVIPAGLTLVAESQTAQLLLGNERIPAFALTGTLPDGTPLDLGKAPIMDALGTNGLTGDVDNHTWRLIWTSVFIGGLRGGQQVLQRTMDGQGAPIAEGIARESGSAAQQRLGRAQDTRPTIASQAGDLCHVLLPKTLTF